MAKFNYRNAQSTAQRLINNFGLDVTFSRVSSSYDAVTGVDIVDSVQSTTATAVSLPASSVTSLAFDDKFKEELTKGKLRFFLIAAKGLTLTPQAGDLLEFEGKVWEFDGVNSLNPAGTPVMYGIGAKVGNHPTIPTP